MGQGRRTQLMAYKGECERHRASKVCYKNPSNQLFSALPAWLFVQNEWPSWEEGEDHPPPMLSSAARSKRCTSMRMRFMARNGSDRAYAPSPPPHQVDDCTWDTKESKACLLPERDKALPLVRVCVCVCGKEATWSW